MLLALTALCGGACATAHAAPLTTQQAEQHGVREGLAAAVEYRLASANKLRCGNALAPMSGLLLDLSVARPGVSGPDTFIQVKAVVAESPAGWAGIAGNNRLIAINGLAFPVGDADSPSLARKVLEQAEVVLRSELAKGEVILRMATRDGHREFRFTPEKGCQSKVEIIDSTVVNAWADGTRVLLTRAILERCDSEADLAFVIAHEMAHNILHHRARLATARHPRSGLLPMSADTAAVVRETEEEADREAVALLIASGYDPSAAAGLLGRLYNPGKGPRLAAPTHPDYARRVALLRTAIAAASSAGI